MTPPKDEPTRPENEIERYGIEPIEVRHGRIDAWLLVVYLVLFIWALYYGFTYWGGLGPGLNLGL
ncbi:MAG TPA: hypothetical protein VLL76_12160 [Candidatus Omnitrophota bacterium]|nr:hypothetical protein [Candidatus Omnitrophota bacterium]